MTLATAEFCDFKPEIAIMMLLLLLLLLRTGLIIMSFFSTGFMSTINLARRTAAFTMAGYTNVFSNQ